MTKLYNKKELTHLRRKLRKQPVSAEKLLWQKLRRKQLGVKFRRQYSINRYIIDFYCCEQKLAIEIDGATHSTKLEREKDLKRQQYIESLNIKLLRYNNSDVYSHIEKILVNILNNIKNN